MTGKALSAITSRRRLRVARRGLAPLELVLSLPILLFVMALIIDFGVAACWKVRAGSVARQAVWRQRWDRTGVSDPPPAGWPTWASPPSVGGGNTLFNDPFAQYPVVRGPTLPAPNGNGNGGMPIRVNQNLLDYTTGVLNGNAQIQVTMPLLPNMPKVNYNIQHPLQSGRWQFDQMNLPQNVWRRIPSIYTDLAQPLQLVPQEQATFQQAAQAILDAPFRSTLMPLDRDDEFYAWYSQHPQPNPDYRPPDFHPRVIRDLLRFARCTLPGRYPPPPQPSCYPACQLDSAIVQQAYVTMHLLPDIHNVPAAMKQRFIRLYNDQITYWKNQTPPNTAQIQALQKIIDTQLQPFVTQ